MEDKERLMTDIHNRIIAIAEKKYGKDSKVAKSFRKNKEIAELNRRKTFREIYFDRPVSFNKKGE